MAGMDSSDGHIRKRVCKACDRCRLKKSKCDGASPCSRCKADNAICVFGERKKLHDKVYPKGYVEMLEQQQTQLVSGLRELYRRLQAGESWPGLPLKDGQSGQPLTHDILERLDLLYVNSDAKSPSEAFEEDFTKMQKRLVDQGAPYAQRRGSVSSDSEHGHASSPASLGTPTSQHTPVPESGHGAPPTPPMDSPFFQPARFGGIKSTPMGLGGGPTGFVKSELDAPQLMRSAYAVNPSTLDDATMVDYISQFDASLSYDTPMAFDQYPMGSTTTSALGSADWMDPNDVDFNHFIDQVAT